METAEQHLFEYVGGYGIPSNIVNEYKESHRFYHTWDHVEDIYRQMCHRGFGDNHALFLAAVYHDIVYDPKRNDNEIKSAERFMKDYKHKDDLSNDVVRIILDTANHKPSNELSVIFCEMDLDILNRSLYQLIEYEHQIFKEYQYVDYWTYKEKRIEALISLKTLVNNDVNIDALISYVSARQPKIGMYPGSFNPFHKGHLNILEKAEQIFDKVIIARGQNPAKEKSTFDLPKAIQYRQIEVYNGLITNFINEFSDQDITLIRGLRNATDLQTELTQYRYLQDLKPDIKMVSIYCDVQYEHISSSAIKQLIEYDAQDSYLLEPIKKDI